MKLEDAIGDIDRRLPALDDAQNAVEFEISQLDKLEEHIEAAIGFREYRRRRGWRIC